MDWLNILGLVMSVMAVAWVASIVYNLCFGARVGTMELLFDEKIIMQTKRPHGIAGGAVVEFPSKKGSTWVRTTIGSGRADVFLTNKRIYSKFFPGTFFPGTKVLDIPLQNILYVKLTKKWLPSWYICLGYRDNEREKEALIGLPHADIDKWNEELQKITAGKLYI